MLFENATDLEDTLVKLERAENLMQMFFECTEDESVIPQNATLEEAKQTALIFTTRFSMLSALIETVFDIVHSEKANIEKISNELLEMSKKEKTA